MYATRMVTSTRIHETRWLKNDIVVFSHLRWRSVTQRPQHIMTRLARDRKIIFVEEPIVFTKDDYGTAHTFSPTENITVVQPRLPSVDDTNDLAVIVQKALADIGVIRPMLWFYTPMFADMVTEIPHSLVVYDCMDELSLFQGAPAALIAREKQLFAITDVVFTGGRSLYEAKRARHPNVHCFPSSVDRAHFRLARSAATQLPHDMRAIPGPRALFYGVIDERMDLALLGDTARALPDVSFVLIGPVVKIDPATIPSLPNVYHLGNKSYNELPLYLKGADVTIMPFAHNESTRFISPTKTLEFMAAYKPIVSTSIRDVVRPYSHVVTLADTAHAFATKITTLLSESKKQKLVRVKKQKEILDTGSWDRTVNAMKHSITEAYAAKAEDLQKKTIVVPHAYFVIQT